MAQRPAASSDTTLALVVLVAIQATTAPSLAQEGLYDPVPGAVSQDHGAAPAPDGVLPVTGADVREDADSANDLNRDGEPPGEPSNPIPAHGATGVATNVDLQWAYAPRTASYDVYFGTGNPPPYVGNTPNFYWVLSVLERDTTYYWQVVAKNMYGSTPGPVWWFRTSAMVTTCPGDLDCNAFIDFGDINAYVLALSNWPAWLLKHPGCPPENGRIGINEFVALLISGGGQSIPCE
ncbi:MAG: hypothetical protein AB1601_11940 [Planctomycetota bacterium]